MKINTILPFSIVLAVLVLFSIDPDTSLITDNTYKMNYRYVAALSDDKINKDKNKNSIKIHDGHYPSVQDLELAQGIKDLLLQAGFDTIDSILKNTHSQISNKLGIEPYVAQIIKEAAKRATGESSII
jgi:hypothetical protein